MAPPGRAAAGGRATLTSTPPCRGRPLPPPAGLPCYNARARVRRAIGGSGARGRPLPASVARRDRIVARRVIAPPPGGRRRPVRPRPDPSPAVRAFAVTLLVLGAALL